MNARFSTVLALALAFSPGTRTWAAAPAPAAGAPAPAAAEPKKAPPAAEDDLAALLLATLSLEDRVAQVIMSYPPLDPEAPVTVGSVIFVGNLLRSTDKVRTRIESLQRRAKVPLLVSADMEGGKLNRLKFFKPLRGVPSGRELGQGDEKNARRWGKTVGSGMKSLGFNCNLGPVLDLADSGLMFESGRSMGADPALVAKLAKAYAQGLSSEGVIPIGKHFPGYGDLDKNSDHALVVTDRALAEIQRQIGAFSQAGDALGGVMLANVGFKSYGSVPSILSPELVSLAHQGGWLTVTDDLAIQTLSEATGGDQEEVVRKAFLAGNDILLTTAPFGWDKGMDVHRVIVAMVKSQPDLQRRLDESVLRVLRLKQRMGLLEPLRAGLKATTPPAETQSAAAPADSPKAE
ncbi:MAG TPA: glycoside hydrolase family 3 N-terminal domain-containing protein [Myxococcales bacterium]